MLTPQATGTSADGRSSRGMLTPLEHEMADGVHTREEEQRFTHVSFC
jgi:anti-sigma regulatory factor (Ser/Thr protein kinase)